LKLTHVLYSGLGGHSTVVFALIEADINREMQHHIIFFGIENVPESYIEKCKELQVGFNWVKKKKGADITSTLTFFKIIRTNRPDVILLHSVNLILPAWFFKIIFHKKLIAIEHQANHLKTRIEWIRSILLQVLAHKVVFLTVDYKEEVRVKLGLIFNKRKSVVISNGINTSVFNPQKKNNPTSWNIGMMSRLTAIKDHPTLLKAIALLKGQVWYGNLLLLIAGDGDTMPLLKQQVNTLGLNDKVKFLGMLDEKGLVDFLQQINLYIHASFGETMSTAIMQAMAMGLPVIASDVPGINNMITNNETGLLVPLKNENIMAEKIIYLMNNTEEKKRLSFNARYFAEANFSNIEMLNQYKKLF